MSSIIKVDQIQLADGSTPTAGDLGLNTTGAVLQVVQNAYEGTTSVTSGSYVDTNLTASITPTSSSSTIYVFTSLGWAINGTMGVSAKLLSQIGGGGYSDLQVYENVMAYVDNTKATFSPVYKHTPSTTSQVDYKFQVKVFTGSGTWRINNNTPNQSTITLMEIAG